LANKKKQTKSQRAYFCAIEDQPQGHQKSPSETLEISEAQYLLHEKEGV